MPQATTAPHGVDPETVREEFKRRRGHWNSDWQAMLDYSPAYVAAYLNFSAYVADRGTMSPKFRELIYVATNCTPTHMFEKGFRNHARQALELGATPDELMSVVATVSAMGFYSYVLTAKALSEMAPPSDAVDEAQVAGARAFHEQMFGEVHPDFNIAIGFDPDFHTRWLEFVAAPQRGAQAALSPKEAHLIALAVHAQCTQLNPDGVRQHARAALAHGASVEEVLDVGRLISSMGIHAMVFALPIITELRNDQP